MKVSVDKGKGTIVADLSAIPKGTQVHQAILHCSTKRNYQPVNPVRVLFDGKSLKLRPPRLRSFDVTDAVRKVVGDGTGKLSFAVESFDNFDAGRTALDIRYAGKSKAVPEQVTGLKVVHHDGQTFLTWRELDMFQPKPERVVWIGKWGKTEKEREFAREPGQGYKGKPRVAAIHLEELRRIQRYKVINAPSGSQRAPKLVRQKDWPFVQYRVYRSTKKITAANLHEAECVGSAAPVNAYDQTMKMYSFKGEYRGKKEVPNAPITTYCVEDGKSIPPGHAYYINTVSGDAEAYYAVVTMKGGTENTSAISEKNSLQGPVAEKKAPIKPVFQYTRLKNQRKYISEQENYYFWPAPPIANVPQQGPRRIIVSLPPEPKELCPLVIQVSSYQFNTAGTFRLKRVGKDSLALWMQSAGDLCYNAGRNTLLGIKEAKVDYYPDRYYFTLFSWLFGQYKVNRSKISGQVGTHFGIRHPELFPKLTLGEYSFDFDQKWNPMSNRLAKDLGPAELARTVDGHKAWDVKDITWYLKQDPGKNIPFMICLNNQPKDGNHGAEYGWQDDPKGLAALRDARQPYLACWQCGGHAYWSGDEAFTPELKDMVLNKPWDRSVPAFSNCSLDNNPGNGDPDDGDPKGQINCYLVWEYETVVDEASKWQMTVFLGMKSPDPTCTVDLTPRHCKAFKPKPGESYKWENRSVKDGNVVASGEVAADKWGLVTLKGLAVSKGRNRVTIERK